MNDQNGVTFSIPEMEQKFLECIRKEAANRHITGGFGNFLFLALRNPHLAFQIVNLMIGSKFFTVITVERDKISGSGIFKLPDNLFFTTFRTSGIVSYCLSHVDIMPVSDELLSTMLVEANAEGEIDTRCFLRGMENTGLIYRTLSLLDAEQMAKVIALLPDHFYNRNIRLWRDTYESKGKIFIPTVRFEKELNLTQVTMGKHEMEDLTQCGNLPLIFRLPALLTTEKHIVIGKGGVMENVD